jgi:arsenate reductase
MAEGILKNLETFPLNKGGTKGGRLEVFSAGTEPASALNPYAVRVMKEIGIDISDQYPKNVSRFLNEAFDYVITVCDNAKETCPVFIGKVKHTLHYSIPDPVNTPGPEDEILKVYIRVRDQIKQIFSDLYKGLVQPQLKTRN